MHDKKRDTILVTGTIAFDLLLHYEGSFPEVVRKAEVLSVSFNTEKFIRNNGGTGANIARDLRLLDDHPLLVASIGPDGEDYLEELEAMEIDTRYVEVLPEHHTATGMACTDLEENQIWFFAQGADIHGTWPSEALKNESIAWAIIGKRYPQMMTEGILWCHENDVPVMFDPGQSVLHFTDKQLDDCVKNSTAVIANEYEWGILEKQSGMSPKKMLDFLDFAVITRGPNGLLILTKEEEIDIPRCDCAEMQNPTGAGDACRAGLLTGLVREWSLRDAGRLGASMGSFAVEQMSTIPDISIEEVWKRAEETYGVALPEM